MNRHLPRWLVAANAAAFYRITFDRRVPFRAQRRMLEAAARSQPLPRGTVVRRVRLGDRPAERITVGATERPIALLYLHGGGYTVGSPATHRSLTAFIAREAGAVVYSLDYRLAPEHPYPAALQDAVSAFLALDRPSARVAIAGDSAGGGLALATTRRLIDDYGVMPGALALLSPWVDPADESASCRRDLVINVDYGRLNALAYTAGADPRDPGIAPMYGELSGLPPTLVHLCVGELLCDQIRRFVARLHDAGVDLTVDELPRLWHSGHTQAGLVREAFDAVCDVATFVRSRLLSAPVPAGEAPLRAG